MRGAVHLWLDVSEGLRSRPGRTAIAFAGVAVGLFALTLTLGILEGFRIRAARLAAELGAHAAALLQPAPPRDGRAPGQRLGRTHLRLLRAAVPEAHWSGARTRTVAYPDGRRTYLLVRTDEALAGARDWRLARGRFLDAGDVRDGNRHAVITTAAARMFGWTVGSAISLDGRVFHVVGVLDASEAPADPATGVISAGTAALLAPWTSIPPAETRESAADLDAIYVRVSDEEALRRAVAVAERVLSAPDLQLASAAWITPELLLRGLRRWRTSAAWGAGLLAALCLLLGGSTLMSLLLSDVRNRVPEIGLRLALGARPLDVARLFLAEACLITTVAACAGLALAWPVLRLLAVQTAVPFRLGALHVLAVVLAALGFGAIFSYVPARLAARVSAAEALRND